MMSVIGRKNAGKTTLLVALAAELARRKFRVMTIKHGTHPADTDQRGKDSWRHWHEGRAERVLMEGPGQRVLWERTEQESDPVALARRYLDGADIVLVEGFKRAPLPKIEVYRLASRPGTIPRWTATRRAPPTSPARTRTTRSPWPWSRRCRQDNSPRSRSARDRSRASSPGHPCRPAPTPSCGRRTPSPQSAGASR